MVSAPTFSGGIAVGAIVALEVLFLANSAYVAAAGGLALSWAITVTAAGSALALAGWLTATGRGAMPTAAGAVALTAAGFLLPTATGVVALVVVLLGQLGAGVVLSRALAPAGSGPTRAGFGIALGWVVGLAITLLFQLHYDSPLPIDNRYLTALLGLLTALALLGAGAVDERHLPLGPWVLVGGAMLVAGVLVGVSLAATSPSPAAVAAPDDSVRVLQWNVRYGVDEDGQLDPEAIADAIEARGEVDVVVLNEVARGWPLSGQLDLAAWMSRRLGLNAVWGAAAGRQAGNLVLTRYPVVASEVVALPKAGRSMGRSFVSATLDRGGDEALNLLATHLQHRNDPASMEARLAEIADLLEYWDGALSTVLAGDLNPRQGDPPEYPVRRPGEFEEIALLLEEGFTTAANLEACDPPTSNDNCSDYILAGPGLTQESLVVAGLFADHRMLVADVGGF
ncbi:MAG: endonuclease/exonuclease/phosphatase [Acidobacteria bacterium]|nr:endonuclease/exonuclease/phosphatase [Acidobacteriota bacterium]